MWYLFPLVISVTFAQGTMKVMNTIEHNESVSAEIGDADEQIQFILRLFETPEQVLCSFDKGICTHAWDGRRAKLRPERTRAIGRGVVSGACWTACVGDACRGANTRRRRATLGAVLRVPVRARRAVAGGDSSVHEHN
jgi:hypothetical protein